MPLFRVKVGCQEAFAYYTVEAETEQEAIELYKQGKAVHDYDEALDEDSNDCSAEEI